MAKEAEFRTLWNEAVEKYSHFTERTEEERKLLERFRTTDELQNELKTERNRFDKFRSKHSKITSKLKLAVQPFISLSSFAAAALSVTPFAPASSILGAAFFVIKAAGDLSDIYDWIEQLFDKLGDFTIRLNEYASAPKGLGSALEKKVVQIFICLLEILACSEKAIKDKRWKRCTAVMFLGQDDVKVSFDKLSSLFDDEHRLVAAINLATNQSMDERLDGIERSGKQTLELVTRVDAAMNSLRDTQSNREILDWISSEDFGKQYLGYIRRKQGESGMWILDEVIFQDWVSGVEPILFCPGMPGAGKTMMASITIEHLSDTVQSQSVGLTYIYCDYKNRPFQNAEFFLASMLRQLVQAQSAVPDTVRDFHDKDTRKAGMTLRDICSSLRHVVEMLSEVYLVIDALDECVDDEGTHTRLLGEVRKLSNLHLLTTSRFLPDIEEEFKGCPRLEVRASEEDIREYIRVHENQIPRCIQNDGEMKTRFQDILVNAVGGMFLLVVLHMEWLRGKTSKNRVFKALEEISESSMDKKQPSEVYKKAYHRTFERINGQQPDQVELAQASLCWISYARRPLKSEELCYALAVDIEDGNFDNDDVPVIQDVLSFCAGLVTVDKETDVVRLVHYTTQEYLEGTRQQWAPKAEFNIASTCLNYISRCSNGHGEYELSGLSDRFQDYCVKHWAEHVRPVQEQVSDLACTMLGSECSLAILTLDFDWISRDFSLDDPNLSKRPPGGRTQNTDLHFTAAFGLCVLSEKILSTPRLNHSENPLNVKNDFNETPLLMAIKNEHLHVTKLFLDYIAEQSTGGSFKVDDSELLCMAACTGNEEMVQLLLDYVTEVDLMRHLTTPLHYASSHGHTSVVKMLLQKGADPNSTTSTGHTTLMLANSILGHYWDNTCNEDGYLDTIALLLNSGADVAAKDENGRTALAWAVYAENTAVFNLLLKHGAGICDNISLEPAGYNGSKEMARALLDRGADINGGGTAHPALVFAAAQGELEFMKWLLQSGADVNARYVNEGQPVYTALMSAARRGNEDCVKLLFEWGADPELQNEDGETVHQQVSRSHHDALGTKMAKLLVDLGAKPLN